MENNKNEDSKCFPMGQTAQEKGFSHVPECYKLPKSHRPNLHSEIANNVSVVDLKGMNDPSQRSIIIQDIAHACRRMGFFQIINHGISQSVLDGALSAANDFFNLPTEEKVKFMSNDVHKPIRYCTSIKDGEDKIQFWRVFLKHYAHPLKDWISFWPTNPSDYREKMSQYSSELHKLSITLMEAITESLGLGPKYITNKLDNGVQVMAVNCYPSCPQPNLTLGLPPHSDYSCLTILHQSSCGLEILDDSENNNNKNGHGSIWTSVPYLHGALQVHVGDHLEVLSNGVYKSVVHRAVLDREMTRFSIASLHSLGMDEKMETAEQLVDDQHLKGYKESSVRDFLDFLCKNDIAQGRSFLQTLKINNA